LLRPAGLFLPGGALWQLGQLAQKAAAKKTVEATMQYGNKL
jgi:hypothetical protein